MDLLVADRPFAEITVSEVSARAGVTRKTFYAHFTSVDEIVREIASGLFREALAEVEDANFRLPLTGSGLGRAIFRRLHERFDLLVPLVTRCPGALFLQPAREVIVDVIFPRILRANHVGAIAEFEREYLAHLTSAALHAGITAWAERGFRDDPDAVADFLMTLLGPAADRVFADAGE
ncbi:MAG: TetR/AcrR family transcriptional regulator [Candidatus Binatia bacterium]